MTAIEDFLHACRLLRYLSFRALVKLRLRNRGSVLGMLWEPLGALIVAGLLSSVWLQVLQLETSWLEYFAYVFIGLMTWGVISTSVSNLTGTLIRHSSSLTSRTLPISAYFIEEGMLSLMPLIMTLPIAIIIALFSGGLLGIQQLLVLILVLTLIVCSMIGYAFSVGVASFFLGDLRNVISSIMRLSFLTTPIIWQAERLGDHQYLLLFNPFYGFIHLTRVSLLNEPLQVPLLLQCVFVTFLLVVLGFMVFARFKTQIKPRALML